MPNNNKKQKKKCASATRFLFALVRSNSDNHERQMSTKTKREIRMRHSPPPPSPIDGHRCAQYFCLTRKMLSMKENNDFWSKRGAQVQRCNRLFCSDNKRQRGGVAFSELVAIALLMNHLNNFFFFLFPFCREQHSEPTLCDDGRRRRRWRRRLQKFAMAIKRHDTCFFFVCFVLLSHLLCHYV